jgi:hypothetical protein
MEKELKIKEGNCAYKNCGKPIIGGRKHKKFCCRNCKEKNRKINKYFNSKDKLIIDNNIE